MYFGAKPDLFRLANEMRNNPTDAEKQLWNQIREFRSKGFVFFPLSPGRGGLEGVRLHLQKYLLLIQYIQEYPCNCRYSYSINKRHPCRRNNCLNASEEETCG